ncbi:cellulase family glycosylhydrolase [Hominifimenecus sp. rT4P-3]|uniref:cellulase family glycosylhydrolase n=1 Tax=Hominifimenecus sp. rT4P-3 TaxID=3242979 RepID=UPI003DA2E241
MGFRGWTDALISGREQGAKVAQGFIESVEFRSRNISNTEYVRLLYATFLDREPDASGMANWQAVLDSGLSRLYVFRGFAESQEFTGICQRYGIIRGNVQLTAPRDQNEGITRFLVRCYRLCLKREPDEGGLNDWCSRILSGNCGAMEAAYGFIFSRELLNRNLSNEDYLKVLYRTFLDREPDSSGFQDWMQRLASGKSRAEVFYGFAYSVEFQKICSKYQVPLEAGGRIPSDSSTPLERHGALSVSGTNLIDQNGEPFQLTGISTHGLAWFPQYVSLDAFRTLRDDWGANLIRLALYTEEYGGYCSGGDRGQLKARIDDGVSYATELGMYAIIDWHILSDGNPMTHKEEAKSFFSEMSRKYRDHRNVLYEICNEPNGGVSWDTIKRYAEEIIPVIRANDPDAVILIGTPTWSQDVDAAARNPIKGYGNLMYSLHFYAATHTDFLREKARTALNKGLPLFITEFSICDASGNGAIDYRQAEKWFQLIDEYNLSYAGWNLSNKGETSALLRSSCQKTSGWADHDLSDTGRWLKKQIQSE